MTDKAQNEKEDGYAVDLQRGIMWDHCPECKCKKYVNKNVVGDGYRECSECGQEWWTDIDYTGVHERYKETT